MQRNMITYVADGNVECCVTFLNNLKVFEQLKVKLPCKLGDPLQNLSTQEEMET